jgi:hypothetical protein
MQALADDQRALCGFMYGRTSALAEGPAPCVNLLRCIGKDHFVRLWMLDLAVKRQILLGTARPTHLQKAVNAIQVERRYR